MTGNLNVQQVSESQTDKEAAINAATLDLDLAMTDGFVVDLTSGNVTITAAEKEDNIYFFLDNATTAGRTVTFGFTKRLFVVHSDIGNTQMVGVVVGSKQIDIFPGNTMIFYTDGVANMLWPMGNGFEEISHFEIGTPAINTTIYQKVMTRACSLDDQFVGSEAFAGTAPSGGSVIYNVQKNGSTIGTITFASTATTATFATTGSVVETLAIGDRISIDTPGDLRTMADISFNLQAQRAD
jgi:hypothetical protein